MMICGVEGESRSSNSSRNAPAFPAKRWPETRPSLYVCSSLLLFALSQPFLAFTFASVNHQFRPCIYRIFTLFFFSFASSWLFSRSLSLLIPSLVAFPLCLGSPRSRSLSVLKKIIRRTSVELAACNVLLRFAPGRATDPRFPAGACEMLFRVVALAARSLG
jgi:hypothetical protein